MTNEVLGEDNPGVGGELSAKSAGGLEITPPPTTRPNRPTARASSLFLINTGDGKGKTTAAMGMVLRSLERGWPTCVYQFVKSGRWHSGEVRLLKSLGAEWHLMGDGFTWDSQDLERSKELGRLEWEQAKATIQSDEFRLVLLDELTYLISWGWIELDDVLDAIRSRPSKVNVIATGRNAPHSLIDLADTVTEMKNVKHAYERGIRAAKGIDF